MPKAEKKKKEYQRAQVDCFKKLDIRSAIDKDVVIRMLREIYHPINPSKPPKLNFQKAAIRDDYKKKLRKALHDRKFLNGLPECIAKGDLDELRDKLYELTKGSHRLETWGGWGLPKRSGSVSSDSPDSSVTNTPPRASAMPPRPKPDEPFDFTGSTVLPNVDIQVIRAHSPNKSVSYRLSDFISDEGLALARSDDGGWLDGARLQFERLKAVLLDTKHMQSANDTLWWSPWPLHLINPSELTMKVADKGEILLTNGNFFSSLQRFVEIHFPHLGLYNPSIQEIGYMEVRPNITLIVRSNDATGGALSSNYKSNISSPGLFSSLNTSSRDPKRFSRSRKERAGNILDPNVPLLGHRHEENPPRKEARGRERFSLPRGERSGFVRDLDAPLVGQHPQDKPFTPSSTGFQYSPSTAHWIIGGGTTEGQVLIDPREKRKEETMSKASAQRDSKRQKLNPKVQSELEDLGSELMTFINEYTYMRTYRNEAKQIDRNLAPLIALATQFLNVLTPRFDNPGSNETEEKSVEFFEAAVRILYRTASMCQECKPGDTVPLMCTLLNRILTAIGDLDVDTSDEPTLAPSADMAILVLESAFNKLEEDFENMDLLSIFSISSSVLRGLIRTLGETDDPREMVPVFRLGKYLLEETIEELREDNADRRRQLGLLYAISISIMVKIRGKVDGTEDEDDEDDGDWIFNIIIRILVLSIERMMGGLKDGTADDKVRARMNHVTQILELTADSHLVKLSDEGSDGLPMTLIEMSKRIFGTSETDLLEQFIVILESLLPVFEQYGSTLKELETNIRAEPQLLFHFLEIGAIIYNEVVLELRQSGAEFIPLANAVSDFTKICSLILNNLRGIEDDEVQPDREKMKFLQILTNFFDSLSTMHQPSNKDEKSSDEQSADSNAEDDEDSEKPSLRRADTVQNFYRSYFDLMKKSQEHKEVGVWGILPTDEEYFKHQDNLLKFMAGQSIPSTVPSGGDGSELKFDPLQSACNRVHVLLEHLRHETNMSYIARLPVPIESSEDDNDKSSEEDDEEE